jgi:hypothetical protein
MDLRPEFSHLQNSARLRRRSHSKSDHSFLRDPLKEYFVSAHAPIAMTIEWISVLRMGDVLTLILTVAELFSVDSNRFLLECGIVVFPEFVCLAIEKLSDLISVEAHMCFASLTQNGFAILDEVPEVFMGRLKDLGFVDSVEFQPFVIPASDSLCFAIRAHRALVQPCPAEIIDILAGMALNRAPWQARAGRA